MVQDAAAEFGPVLDLPRAVEVPRVIDVDWYVSHLSGCLSSYAAGIGEPDLWSAMAKLQEASAEWWAERDWDGEYRKRRIERGEAADAGEDDDAPF